MGNWKIENSFGVYTAAMGFTSDACWFLPIKTYLIKTNKKREAAPKNEAGGTRNMCCFFLLGLTKMTTFGDIQHRGIPQRHFRGFTFQSEFRLLLKNSFMCLGYTHLEDKLN